MKRRGFLGLLFGAPAVAVAGKAIADLPKVESEPTPDEATVALSKNPRGDICVVTCFSAVAVEHYVK